MEKTEALKLLAIDDKPDNLSTLSAVVREVLPQTLVLTATNGRAGIELAVAEDPDVILLDIVMPGMDGFEVCRRLKADDRLKDIPVVFLTALKTDTASRVKALEVGGEGFLAKPLETTELTAQIRAMTKVKAANRSQRTEKERLEALVAERTAELQVHQIELEMQNEELQQARAKVDALLAQYTDLYDFAPTGYLSLDREGAILRVNLTGALLLGDERSRLDNRRFGQFVAGSDRRAFNDFLEKVFASEAKTSCEVTLPKEGSQPLVVRLEGRRSEDGQECRAAVLDITGRKRAEAALADEAGRRLLLMEQSRDGIVILDQDGQVCESNRKFAEMLGYPRESMRQLNVRDWEFLHPLERLIEMLRSVDDKGDHFETQHRRNDGSTYDVEISTNAAWFAGQKLILCICRDMTDRKRTEEALRTAERNLRSTVDGLSANIAVVDEYGEVILTNKSYHDFAEQNGIEPSVVSEGVNYLAACDTASGEHSEEAKPFAEGIREVLSGKRQSFELEYPCHSPDEKRWFIGRVTPFAGEGHRRVIVAHENITARKQAEEALRESAAKFRAMVDTFPLAIHQTVGVEQITEYVNPTMVKLFGYTQVDIPSVAQWWPLAYPDETYRRQIADEWTKRVKHAIATQSSIEPMEVVCTCKDGSKKNISWGYITLGDKNYSCGLDITERKQAEEAMMHEQVFSNTIIDSIPGPFYVLDERGGYARWNGYQRDEIVGKPEGEIAGFSAIDTIHPDDREAIGARIANVLTNGTVETVEGRVLLRGGPAFRWLVMTGRRMAIDGKTFLVGIGIDITERKQAEAKLAASEDRIRSVFASMTEMVVLHELVCDEDGRPVNYRILDCNPAFTQITGIRRDDAVGRLATDVYGSDTAPYLDKYARVALTGEPYAFITSYTPINKHFDINVASTGKNKFVTVATDITERKQAEAKLLELNMAVEQSGEGIALADMDEHIVFVNKAWAEMHGYAAEELIGQHLSIFHTPEQLETEVIPFIERLIATGSKTGEMGHSRKDGTTFITHMTVTIAKDATGTPFGLLAAARDITERKQAAQELVRLSTAIEQSAEVVVITDAQGTIQYVNPVFTQNTGYTREEALGQNPRILKSGMQDAEFYRRMWAALTAGEVFDCRMVNRRKDGTLYTEEATISPVKDASGRILNYVAVKRDITEHLREEEERAELISQLNQAQKMESVGRLAGGVAHDFNNLLMGIMGYTELCQEQIAPDHPIRGFLDEIKTSAQRSAAITRQLLAFARKQTIEPRILDLNDAVGGMLKLMQRLIGEDVRLTWRPAADLPRVKLDPAQVDQILANLCVNARDAIAGVGEIVLETGSVVIGADLCAKYPEAIPGAYVCLTVSDNGCGMDKETLAQVFEPFFTTKGVGEGTGLGLATVYGIVKQNNGFIYAYSEPGRDTTFRIILPAIAAAAAAPVTGEAETPAGRWETVLVVEDSPSVRKMCRRFLEALGYKALEAETPEEALMIAKRYGGDIHLVLTDVVMPGMDGRQLAQLISAVKPGIKVLFMSGYTADVIAQRGVVDEGVQFLPKPFTRDDLARKVREVLEAD